MNSHNDIDDDDVDDFLYGDSPEDKKRATQDPGMNDSAANKSPATPADQLTGKAQEDDEDIYQLYRGSSANEAQEINTRQDMELDEEESDKVPQSNNAEAMEHDDESDDDLEIILEPEETSSSQQEPTTSTAEPDKSATLVNIKPGQQGRASSLADSSSTPQLGNASSGGVSSAAKMGGVSGGINLKAVGEYNGTSITEVDLDSLEDKPWRKPGADITDYFNYGFNEVTWRAYCAQQKMLRESRKMMGDIDMSDFMPMGMMMPPGMMDGGMPMGMPNAMMGMPPMGIPPHVGMNSPSSGGSGSVAMHNNIARGGGTFGMRGGRLGNAQMGRPSNRADGNNERGGNDQMNGSFFWPQMQPPFFS